ncbi:response regulator transcription factor [Candidatus Bipolaricaulota bacterium]|nr:response regulator transcription factor [Candidatus Bipolaricaulota bacterium]
MNRRNGWVLLLCLGIALLAVGIIVETRNVGQYRDSIRNAFRDSCRRQVLAFEEFAEHWIVRDQLDALASSAKLLLMGSGLYIDVVVQGQILFNDYDEGLDIEPPYEVVEFDAMLTRTVAENLPSGAVEVRTPIILTGYKESSIGFIRIGFSGNYVNSEIRRYALSRAWIGFGAWLGAMMGLAMALWLFQRRRRSTDASILQCGTLRIDINTCEVHLNGQSIELTPKLYNLLLLFARQPSVILTDQDILGTIWSESTYAASSDVKQCVYMLRRKLRAAHPDPKQIIVNVKGFGYRFEPPANEDSLSID